MWMREVHWPESFRRRRDAPRNKKVIFFREVEVKFFEVKKEVKFSQKNFV